LVGGGGGGKRCKGRGGRGEEEISFSSKSQSYCVCFVSMVDSIGATFTIRDPDKVRRYYSIFINTMAAIARNFGAKVIKNTGTSLLYYFPKTSDSCNLSAFKDVIACGVTMMVANKVINMMLKEEELPSLQYKISADYGRVEVARSLSSPDTDDLFGSTMNICAKINSMASPNGMVIGSDLYYVAKKFSSYSFEGYGHHYYNFKRIGDYSIAASFKHQYPVYSVVVAVIGGGEEQIVNILDLEKQFPKLQKPSPSFPFPAETTHKVNKGLEPPYLNYEGYQPENQKLERQTQQQKKASPATATIMLVDDDPDILLTYKTFLTIGGYNVDAFTDPREALMRFAQADPNNYNLVVMDIRMPNLNGLQLYYRLKAINPNIKILFVSALDAAQEMVSILPAVKLDDIIRKPVDQKQFLYKAKTAAALE
jgi:two-component system, OmpR family, response regulator ChvI